jgi:glycerophosphoryl diester phosphodiesterase
MLRRYRNYLLFLLFYVPVIFTGCKTSVPLVKSYQEGAYLVAAHRGLHTEAPENSVRSIKKAIESGIDIVEIDVRISKDGIPILMHDETVDRTTNGSGKVIDLDLAQMQKLQLLNKNSTEQIHQKIPTLKEVLKIGRGKIIFDLDIKTTEIEKIMEVVKTSGAEEGVIFFDSDWAVLEIVNAVHPT